MSPTTPHLTAIGPGTARANRPAPVPVGHPGSGSAAGPDRLLRRVVLADALVAAGTGPLVLAGSGLLAGPLGLPVALLAGAGAALVLLAPFLWVTARRLPGSTRMLRVAIAVNTAWVAASAALLVALDPTPLGIAFVASQGTVVLLLTIAEVTGLRRVTRRNA